jgi:hypothetical protein
LENTTRRDLTRVPALLVTRPSRQCARSSGILDRRSVLPRNFGTTHFAAGTTAGTGAAADGGASAGAMGARHVSGGRLRLSPAAVRGPRLALMTRDHALSALRSFYQPELPHAAARRDVCEISETRPRRW